MITKHKRKTIIYVGLGLLLSLFFGAGFLDDLDEVPIASRLVLVLRIASPVFFIAGCFHYAEAKGYSRWWGLLGFLSVIGLLVLVFFPDRHKHYKAADEGVPQVFE